MKGDRLLISLLRRGRVFVLRLLQDGGRLTFLGGATCLGTPLPSHKMQSTFLNCRKSVSARALNNPARYNDVDFTRLKANVSNTGRVVGGTRWKAIYTCHCKPGPYRIKAATNFYSLLNK